MSRYLFAAFLLISHICLAQQPGTAINTANWKTAATDSYSVKYPPTWQLDKSAQLGTVFFLFSPLTSANDKFKENFNLTTEDISAFGVSLDKYVDGSKISVQNMLKNARFISDSKTSIGGRDCRHLVYTGDKDAFHLYFEAYIFVVNQRAYLFSFSGEKKALPSYRNIIKAVTATLTFNTKS